ncbi:transcription elongation factor GreA [Patescibacteria group bacterium]|nr:transcription elongation factor GreA [Patescibacteria group bacterium]
MTDQTQYMTQEKLEELKQELENLKLQELPKIAKRIDDARQMGDLSENAEYHQAREDMAWMQSRVKEINAILDNAEIITTGGGNTVEIGSFIVVKVGGDKREYTIVGGQEADPTSGRISNESPIGSAFLGRKKGDTVEVKLPSGVQEFKIVEVR